MSNTIETVTYGEVSNLSILTIFGNEMTYNELKFYAKDKDNTTHLKVEWNRNTETQLVRVWFDNQVVMDKKYSVNHSCDMFYHLGEMEAEEEEETEEETDDESNNNNGMSSTSASITCENLYDYIVIEEWDEEDKTETDGFSYTQNYDLAITEEMSDTLHDKMLDEIRLNYENFNNERSCMWVEEVKRRAKWVRGETLYGYSREKHLTYPIWWSRDKEKSVILLGF